MERLLGVACRSVATHCRVRFRASTIRTQSSTTESQSFRRSISWVPSFSRRTFDDAPREKALSFYSLPRGEKIVVRGMGRRHGGAPRRVGTCGDTRRAIEQVSRTRDFRTSVSRGVIKRQRACFANRFFYLELRSCVESSGAPSTSEQVRVIEIKEKPETSSRGFRLFS